MASVRVFVFVLLLRTVEMAELKDKINLVDNQVQKLTDKLDFITAKLDNIEIRIETEIQRATQGLFEELKNTIRSFQTLPIDTSELSDLTQNLTEFIMNSVQQQSATVYKTFADEKSIMEEIRHNIESNIGSFKTKTDNNIKVLHDSLEEKVLHLSDKLDTGKEDLEQRISRMNNFVDPMLKKHKRKVRRIKDNIKYYEEQVLENKNAVDKIKSRYEDYTAFSARLTHNPPTIYKGATVINEEVLDMGNGYAQSLGVYTAPVSGVYLFIFNVECVGNGTARVGLTKNGNRYMIEKLPDGNRYIGYEPGGNTKLFVLEKGEEVWIHIDQSEPQCDIAPYRTTFSGSVLHILDN